MSSDCAGLKENLGKSQLVLGGCPSALQDQCLQITGLSESHFPINYLGMPITVSRLTKIECRGLVEKIWPKSNSGGLETFPLQGGPC